MTRKRVQKFHVVHKNFANGRDWIVLQSDELRADWELMDFVKTLGGDWLFPVLTGLGWGQQNPKRNQSGNRWLYLLVSGTKGKTK
jgi:hypothetical protein